MSGDRHAIVGAGIVGLALARALTQRGHRVTVFEADRRAQGASVRNFGTLWPIGQPRGKRRAMAMTSLAIWRDVLAETASWSAAEGSIHVAYHADEAAVLTEFADAARRDDLECEWLDAEHVRQRCPLVKARGLVGGLWSPHEIQINPRQLTARLSSWLAQQRGVEFQWATRVVSCSKGTVRAGDRLWDFDFVWVASGADVQTLYPDAFAARPLRLCKLQMLRTAPIEWRVGPILAAGLTLGHYDCFAVCPTLPALRQRLARDWEAQLALGIHVLVSRHDNGEVVIGDSHEYDDAIDPFDRVEIEARILDYMRTFIGPEVPRIVERWHGIYLRAANAPYCVFSPEDRVTVVAGLGGHGMTMAFGLAEQIVGGGSRR